MKASAVGKQITFVFLRHTWLSCRPKLSRGCRNATNPGQTRPQLFISRALQYNKRRGFTLLNLRYCLFESTYRALLSPQVLSRLHRTLQSLCVSPRWPCSVSKLSLVKKSVPSVEHQSRHTECCAMTPKFNRSVSYTHANLSSDHKCFGLFF